MDAEELIITKKYFELTPSELKIVSELVSNEAEFDDMKSFLMATRSAFESQKIKSTPDLDEKIMAHLHASPAQNKVWYKSFMLFLFPRDKHFYKYPAFQLVAVSVLIFGVFNIINFDSLKGESLAYEDVSKAEEPKDGIEQKTYMFEETTEKEIDGASKSESDFTEEEVKEEPIESPIATNEGSANQPVTVMNDITVQDEENDLNTFDADEELLDEIVSLEQSKVEERNDKTENTSSNAVAVQNEVVKMEEESESEPEENYVYSTTSGNSFKKEDQRKKKEKDLKPKTEKTSAPAANYDKVSEMDDEIVIPQKLDINTTPEIMELFFEVK